jgi:hypothetical protein
MITCTSLVLGLHLATAHVDPGMKNLNPGVYAVCDGIIAGTYRNSLGGTTAYAGYRWDITPHVGLTAAVGAGYGKGLQVGIIPSVRVGHNWRLNFIVPSRITGGGGIHISWEKEL